MSGGIKDRGKALLALNRAQAAVELIGPVAAGSADPDLHSLLVLALFQAGQVDEAATAANAALVSVGPDPLFGLVRAQLAVGDHAAARSAVDAALLIAPAEAGVQAAAGEVAEAGGRSRPARAHYRRALRLDPCRVDAMIGRGRLEELRRRFGRALHWYARALAAAPDDARLSWRVQILLALSLESIAAAGLVLTVMVLAVAVLAAAPGGAAPGVFWVVLTFVPVIGVLCWRGQGAAPRTFLDALRPRSRFRRVRRVVRRIVAQGVLLAMAVAVALVPIDPEVRRSALALVVVTAIAVGFVNVIGIRRAFGLELRQPPAALLDRHGAIDPEAGS